MEPEDLLAEFETSTKDGWTHLAGFLREEPGKVEAFVEGVFEKLPRGGTFFDAALSFVSEDALKRLVPAALRRLREPVARGAAEGVIRHTALQFPQCLHPYLPEIFALRPNEGKYCENWPWRESGPGATAFLLSHLRPPAADARTSMKAWGCLLEQRTPEALDLARQCAGRLDLDVPEELYFLQVGFRLLGEQLYPQCGFHLIFPPNYLVDEGPVEISRELHPTWHLSGETAALRFGGDGASGCGLCGGQLHHLVSLPGSFVFGSGVEAQSIPLEVCLSCLGWEESVLRYSHEANGRPISLDHGAVTPEFPGETLRETTALLVPTPSRWRWQDWALSNGRENLNRVGGHPTWVQSAEYPDCAGCGQPMHFLLQLDSDLPTADGGEWLWGSGGICYAFSCRSCRHTAFLWQCT